MLSIDRRQACHVLNFRRQRNVTADALPYSTLFVLSFFLSFLFVSFFSSFFHFPTEIYTLFSSAETSAIDLKLQYNVQNGLNSRSRIIGDVLRWKAKITLTESRQTDIEGPRCYAVTADPHLSEWHTAAPQAYPRLTYTEFLRIRNSRISCTADSLFFLFFLSFFFLFHFPLTFWPVLLHINKRDRLYHSAFLFGNLIEDKKLQLFSVF